MDTRASRCWPTFAMPLATLGTLLTLGDSTAVTAPAEVTNAQIAASKSAPFKTAAAQTSSLEAAFFNPPATTKPRCYWYWMKGQVSREGITRDLENMKRVGVGEGYIGVIEGGELKALTPEWWGLIEHAIREGGRLGVDVGLFNGPGWSQSGGPWVKPNQSMRYVVTPEIRVRGPQHFESKLPIAEGSSGGSEAKANTFQDIAVLAFPAPLRDDDSLDKHQPRMTVTTTQVTYAVDTPFTARSLVIQPDRAINTESELQISDDGQTYRTVKKFVISRYNFELNRGPRPLASIAVSFPPVTARFFRITMATPSAFGSATISGAARLEDFQEKQLAKLSQTPQPGFDFYTWPAQAEPDNQSLIVPSSSVRDLRAQMGQDGTLRWDVPPGNWIILRTGMQPTGVTNGPAPPEATGLEVDKMSRSALRDHFNAYIGHVLRSMPAAQRTAFKHVVADSYETGSQNWTDDFVADFKRRYGYAPLPYSPVLTGRLVGSADQSNRFLWDVRRMVADRISRDYVGGLRDLCNQHGLKMWLENYGHWGFPGEFLQYGGACDEIAGEFWENGNLGDIELRDASSAAHIYGKTPVFAEAWTGGPPFSSTPWSLKKRGDWAMCQGINQFVLHVNISQPWEDRQPGVNAGFGTEFNRHNTWFPRSKAWIDYLRRCTVMLQQGQHVADVLYYIGEDAPKMTGIQNPALPSGYDYDYVNAEVIEKRLTVKNGRFVLPDGASYKLLILPPESKMRPEVLRKLRDLVMAGGAVLGPPPTASPSLANYPSCDVQVKRIARELWGTGRVIGDTNLEDAFARLNTIPDVANLDASQVLFTHRRLANLDIYFLSNQTDAPLAVAPQFRTGGRLPQLWHPETGRIEKPALYDFQRVRNQGVTTVPLRLEARGSVFVVFQPSAIIRHTRETLLPLSGVLQVTRDGLPLFTPSTGTARRDTSPIVLTRNEDGATQAQVWQSGQYVLQLANGTRRAIEVAKVPPPVPLSGAWRVQFDPRWGGPMQSVTFDQLQDWTQSPNQGIHYYSGTATYHKSFTTPEGARTVWLNLGEVHDLARVTLNGRDLGTLWQAPYRLNVTKWLKPGSNTLEIEITNTWRNRLVGDAQPNAAKQWTFLTEHTVGAGTPLLPAGLVGPVRLEVPVEVNLKS